jgi:hypothetical protein
MIQKLSFLLILLTIGITKVNAQEVPAAGTIPQDTIVPDEPVVVQAATQPAPPAKQRKSVKDKLYYGGYVNLSLGKYTMIGIEPMIGYIIIPRLSVGAKIKYDYIQDKRYSQTYTSSNYGASIFTRLKVFRGLYAHAEYAGYNYKYYNAFEESSREWIPFLFVGAGYTMRVGKRSSLNAQVLFDVLRNEKSPYKSWEPFYSVGIGVGF